MQTKKLWLLIQSFFVLICQTSSGYDNSIHTIIFCILPCCAGNLNLQRN